MISRDTFRPCPRCGQGLEPIDAERLACGRAGKDGDGCGVLLSEATLRRIVLENKALKPEGYELPFEAPKRVEPKLACPMCAGQMDQHALYAMQVDRCPQHGVWFDERELAAVLLVSGQQGLDTGDKIGMAISGLAGAGLIALQILRFIWF